MDAAREALNNARLRSGATSASFKLGYGPHHLRVVVQDNGRGSPVPESIGSFKSTGKLGLAGMHKRARLLGGKLSLQSVPGAGTSLSLELDC